MQKLPAVHLDAVQFRQYLAHAQHESVVENDALHHSIEF